MDQVTDDNSFSAAVNAEYGIFQEFRHVLQQEHDALVAAKTELLLQLAPRKSELVEKLSAFSAKRNLILQKANLENTTEGMAALLDRLGADDATRELWDGLLEIARDAEQVNRANGILIESQLRHNQQAMAALRAAINPGSLYGANGQISGASSGRTRDKA